MKAIQKYRREFWSIIRILLDKRYKNSLLQVLARAEFDRIMSEYVPINAELDIFQRLDAYVESRRNEMQITIGGETLVAKKERKN